MNFDVELMDPEFQPGSSDESDSFEDVEVLEFQDEVNEESDSNENLEDSEEGAAEDVYEGSEESSECEELIEESLVYDDTVLIEKLDMLHYDFMMIFTILVVMFARICLNSLRSLALNSYKALRR